jgi:hypothetical protein
MNSEFERRARTSRFPSSTAKGESRQALGGEEVNFAVSRYAEEALQGESRGVNRDGFHFILS